MYEILQSLRGVWIAGRPVIQVELARRPISQPWRDWSALAYWPEQLPERKSK
jgi:hypothetical protein